MNANVSWNSCVEMTMYRMIDHDVDTCAQTTLVQQQIAVDRFVAKLVEIHLFQAGELLVVRDDNGARVHHQIDGGAGTTLFGVTHHLGNSVHLAASIRTYTSHINNY